MYLILNISALCSFKKYIEVKNQTTIAFNTLYSSLQKYKNYINYSNYEKIRIYI